MINLFIIDDEPGIHLILKKILESEGYQVRWTPDPEDGLSQITSDNFGCVLLDMKLGEVDGLHYLEKIHEIDSNLPVIVITGYETVKTAVEAIKRGAFYYLPKPFDNEEIKAVVANAVKIRTIFWQLQSLKNKQAAQVDLESAMGHSFPIQKLAQQIHAVAQIAVNVLLTGESGTGKELVAKTIHQLSSRKTVPWMVVDCASIPESLIESALFGHEKGSFTGAYALQKGMIELADGGILFLDEISNTSMNIQAKLLRFLETRAFQRIGSCHTISVSTRVIAATNRPLQQLIKDGTFREDLYHRLNEFPIELPPLRQRCEDVAYLSLKFLHEFQAEIGKSFSEITEGALEKLQQYSWPGNVRELRNIIKRTMVMANGKIEKSDLPQEIQNPSSLGSNQEIVISLKKHLPFFQVTREVVSTVEKQLIRDALQQSEHRKSKTAKLLGIDEKTLYNKLKEYKIR